MQTLKKFLQSLTFKKNKTISRNAKSLILALKKCKTPEMLDYEVRDTKEGATQEPEKL